MLRHQHRQKEGRSVGGALLIPVAEGGGPPGGGPLGGGTPAGGGPRGGAPIGGPPGGGPRGGAIPIGGPGEALPGATKHIKSFGKKIKNYQYRYLVVQVPGPGGEPEARPRPPNLGIPPAKRPPIGPPPPTGAAGSVEKNRRNINIRNPVFCNKGVRHITVGKHGATLIDSDCFLETAFAEALDR